MQTEEAFSTYAEYLSAFVSSYEAAGVPVWAMTVQNEPHVAGQFLFTYPCMGYEGADEGAFLGNYLGPKMANDHPGLKIFVHDDQKAMDGSDPEDGKSAAYHRLDHAREAAIYHALATLLPCSWNRSKLHD